MSHNYNYNIEDVKLTSVKSGDQDNNIYYSYYNGNQELKQKILDTYLELNDSGQPFAETLIDCIFRAKITGDNLRQMMTAITFWDAMIEITKGNSPVKSADDLLFAILVNYNCDKGVSKNRIRSFQALQDARESSANNDGLDYREYLINVENGNFENDYVAIPIDTTDNYSCKMILNIPIIKLRLGRFRFATERIAGYMTFNGDPDNTQVTVAPGIWMEMVNEGVNNRITPKFSKLESRSLQKVVDKDPKYIDDILAQNDFKSRFNFMNVYDLEVNDNGEIVISNTKMPPEINIAKMEWTEKSGNRYVLNSYDFYIAKTTRNAVHILQQV